MRTAITVAAFVGTAVVVACPRAHAGPVEDAVEGLAAPSEDKIEESIRKLGELDDPRAIAALDALCDDRLRIGADGHPYIWDSKTRDTLHPMTGAVVSAPRPLKEVEVGNEIRRVALPVLAQLQLGSPTAAVRLAAAEELSKNGGGDATALLHKALAREKDGGVRDALSLAVARADLAGSDPGARVAALEVIGKSANDSFL